VKLARRPTHVLFDLDGVLLDSEPLYTQATQEILDPYGKTFDWSLKVHTIGRDARDGAGWLLAELGIPLGVEEYLERRERRLRDLFRTVQSVAGAREFVRALAERGVPMAVATSSHRDQYEVKVGSHPWFESFQAIVCGDDPELGRLKPAPDIFLLAAARLAADPESCLVVEDSPAGVEAARAAGMQVVAVPDPHVAPERVAAADLVVSGMVDLEPGMLGL
jgi:pseudouridine 5'-phosphatase